MKLNTYWLDWRPENEKFGKSLERSLTELTKGSSVSSVSATPAHFQNFFSLESEPNAYEEGFSLWVSDRCRFLDRAWWNLGALHRDYCDWCAQTGKDVPGSLNTFKVLLQDSGFKITDDGLVYGLALTQDLFRKSTDYSLTELTKPMSARR